MELLAGLPPALIVVVVAAVPVIELRGAIPIGLALGLDLPAAFAWSLLGNVLPIPVLLLLLDPVGRFLRRGPLSGVFAYFERRALRRSDLIHRYGPAGLIIFVGIPLPVTGVWTGSLLSVLLGIPPARALSAMCGGLLVAAGLISLLSWLGFSVLKTI